MKLLDCKDCRMGFHCHRCLCCAPEETIRRSLAQRAEKAPTVERTPFDSTEKPTEAKP